MASPNQIADLPVEFLATEDPLVGMFVPLGIQAHQALVEASAKFETLRESENRAAAALEESTDPAAVAYRQAKEATDTTVESIKAERDAELDKIKASFAAKIKEATTLLKEQETATLKQIQADSVSDIDATSLVVDYTAKLQALKLMGNNLKEQCPELHAYVKALPTRNTAVNGKANSDKVRNWTPRLVVTTVIAPDGTVTNVEPTTLGNVAKFVGGTRQHHSAVLLGAIGSPDNLSSDPEHPSVYYIEKNGETWQVQVVERSKSSDNDDE